MKPTTSTQTLQSNGIKSSVSFGIKDSGFAHIFNVLRNQLYSDKVLAVVREYSCNAFDAHVAAGKASEPIKVTLPNRLNPNLSIRDYGDALSDDDIKNIYAFYGESTKRNTNDQIGMLGIGSKAAFAYGDNFVINSYINGKRHTYNAFIDPSQVGQISKLESDDTDEPNGIEIVVPVKLDDADEFVEKARRLFKHFPVKPTICGTQDFVYEKADLLFEGDGWQWNKSEDRYGHGDATAIMGNIAYPIEKYSLNLKDEDAKLTSLLRSNLIMKFDIGDLEISASREKLQFTDKTKKAILDRLRVVEKQVVEKALEEFGECSSMFSAKCLYGSLMDWTSGLYDFRDILSKKLKWKNTTISSDHYNFSWKNLNNSQEKEYVGKLVVYKKPDRGFKWRSERTEIINCTKDVVVIKNDLGHTRGMMGRVLPLVEDQKKKVYMFTFNDDISAKAMLDKEGFDGKMILASSLEKKKVSDYYTTTSTSRGNTSAHASKHQTAVFELDWDMVKAQSEESSWHRNKTNSAYYNALKVDLVNDSGVYVVIDKFQIYSDHEEFVKPVEMQGFKTALEKYDIEVPTLVAVKVKEGFKAEENPNMINFFDWATIQLKKIIEEGDLIQKLVDSEAANSFLGNDWMRGGCIKAVDFITNEKSPYAKFIKRVKEMQDHKNRDTYQNLRDVMERVLGASKVRKMLNVKPSFNLAPMKSKVEKRYAMLTILDGWTVRNMDDDKNIKKIANYINIVDVASI
jgi:hypothetical protein